MGVPLQSEPPTWPRIRLQLPGTARDLASPTALISQVAPAAKEQAGQPALQTPCFTQPRLQHLRASRSWDRPVGQWITLGPWTAGVDPHLRSLGPRHCTLNLRSEGPGPQRHALPYEAWDTRVEVLVPVPWSPRHQSPPGAESLRITSLVSTSQVLLIGQTLILAHVSPVTDQGQSSNLGFDSPALVARRVMV